MIKKLVISLFLAPICIVFAQYKNQISGIVLNSKTLIPLNSVVVTIQNTTKTQLTTSNGSFEFTEITNGEYLVLIHSQGFKEILIPISIADLQYLNLGTILLEEDLITEQQVNTIVIFDNDLTDENGSSESTSGLLQSTKDAFRQAAAFNWGQARFRIRGLDNEQATTLINGSKMNKFYDGRPQWSNWGGLNNVTSNQEFTIGTSASDYAFGGILGVQEMNTRASLFRAGTRITFSGTNTNYNWRTMATYASGMKNNGWSYVISGGKRWAEEAHFEGTNYNANSLFSSLEKKLNDKHSINFSGFYTPNSRGKNSPNTNEVSQLTSTKYNSYWGYQNGIKRNSRIKTVDEPILMLNHYFTINERTNLNSGLKYQLGKISNSNIDYQNGNSPDPTYFRKLPSYYSSLYERDNGEFSGAFIPDADNAEKSRLQFLANPQIDWESLYRANQKPVLDANGKITAYEPAQSHYVLYEDRTEDRTWSANTVLTSQMNDNLMLNAGVSFTKLFSHNFQKMTDLLGGAFFEDIDAFYQGNQAQSDLNHPNRKVIVGDIYGYNFNYFATNFEAFTQFKFILKKVDFYLAQSFSNTNYQREGLYKNGIYENNSFGKSEKVAFENFGFKGGFTIKISGKQSLTLNSAHLTKAPTLKNTFPNARINNSVVSNLQDENLSSIDLTYVFRTPKFQSRLTAYYSTLKNTTSTSFFYAEGIFDNGAGYENTNAFVGQTLSNLNKRNSGIELSLEYQWNPTLKSVFAAAYGKYIYDNNPNLSVTNDAVASTENTNPSFDFGTTFLKNYKQEGMPQQALSIGLEYRNPKYWWVATNVNYLAENYVGISPIARTNRFFINPASGFPFPEANEERAKGLLEQEKLQPFLLLNIIGGKSWKFKKTYAGLFFSINNILDTTYKTGGYEQARNANYRQRNQDVSSGTPSFGNKYFYGYGRTYYINLNFSL